MLLDLLFAYLSVFYVLILQSPGVSSSTSELMHPSNFYLLPQLPGVPYEPLSGAIPFHCLLSVRLSYVLQNFLILACKCRHG